MKSNICVGDIVKRNGKPVKVKALLPGNRFIIQFREDALSSSPGTQRRHYEYHIDELEVSATTIGIEYEITVFDNMMQRLGATAVKDFPNGSTLLKVINEHWNGRYAQVSRRYVAE